MNVAISEERYLDLLEKEAKLKLLEDFLFCKPELNYTYDGLVPNHELIDMFYKTLYPTRTKAMIIRLNEERKKREEIYE